MRLHLQIPDNTSAFHALLRGCSTLLALAHLNRARNILEKHLPAETAAIYNVANMLIRQDTERSVAVALLHIPLPGNVQVLPDSLKHRGGKDVLRLLADWHRFSTTGMSSNDVLAGIASEFSNDPEYADSMKTLVLALRLIELERLIQNSRKDAFEKAEEAIHLLAPVASRLHMQPLRRCLEDTALYITNPRLYRRLKHDLAPVRPLDSLILHMMRGAVTRLLAKTGIRGKVFSRIKSLYSICCKAVRTGRNIQAIMDRIGLRIIVGTVPECYRVLNMLHTHFEHIPDCFDDYICQPKANGYQSLHSCVYPLHHLACKPVEFQIRTEEMHGQAESGSAAHALYKYRNRTSTIDRSKKFIDTTSTIYDKNNGFDANGFLYRLRNQLHQV